MPSELLICPACNEPCESVPPCNTGHPDCSAEWGVWPTLPPDAPTWCEDRGGTCACGASLVVRIDDGIAELVEVGDAE